MTETQVRALLRKSVDAAGGQRAWAKANGFDAGFVNRVLSNERPLSENICEAIGVRRIVVYTINYGKLIRSER